MNTTSNALAATLRRAVLLTALCASLGACAVIRGQESLSEYTSDATITADIKSHMASDKDVAATAISVETMNGVTQLSGFAKSQMEKDRAAAIARQSKGVKSVRNDIVVRP